LSFFSEFFAIPLSTTEQAVCCPFEHGEGQFVYHENHPSAHVNTEKHVFHCKACGKGLNETQFIEQILHCSAVDAIRILKYFETADSRFEWKETRKLSHTGKELALNLGISEEVIAELDLATPIGKDNALQFPVFLYNQLLDIRTYTPTERPKVKSRSGSMAGLIIPYDIWRTSPKTRTTIICAGEKDMAVARSNGLNAITITGGEEMSPRILSEFKDRKIAICYDNDEPGRTGAKQLANTLISITPTVRVVTGFHEVCKENKEDITDFFVKYKQTRADLIRYIEQTPYYTPDPSEKKVKYPIMDLFTATQPENINQMVQSNIQVVAVTDTTFTIPNAIILEKFQNSGDKDTMTVGECRTWEFDEHHLKDTLHMMDNNFNETTIKQNIKELLKIPKTERCVKQRTIGKHTVFKAYITDLFETSNDAVTPMEFQAYSFGTRLESGKKYLVTYKLVPHPYKGQQLTMLILKAEQANDSVSDFKITDEVKTHLNVFKSLEGSVSEKITLITNKVKGLLGYNGNDTLIQTIDFAYHTALQFNFGSFSNVRGYLDTLIIGESRVGKSSTAETLRRTYGLGVFTSLAGNSATIPGLIGGSNKTPNGFQTRAGVIPQNHRGLVIFEEFGKCKQDIISELTDIRSSGEVRIARVSGTITLPALVRMVALSNVKTTGGNTQPIAAYPHGIAIITELVGTAEDIARYDLITVLSDRGTSQIDPFWVPEKPFELADYQARIRWIWSRSSEEIQIDREVGLFIMDRANALNKDFDCHIKIFGTEAWKKLSRLAIAIAGYLVSTDDEYKNIIVLKEHVEYAEQFFRSIYDNATFRLREYVANERMYSELDTDGLAALQDLYTKYPALVIQLSKSAVCSKNMLSSASGLTADELNRALSRLTKGLFIQYQGYDIVPTERFRKGYNALDKNTIIPRVGEE
jgi:hypothetical protein